MRRGVPGHATCPGMIVSWDEGAMSPDRILSGDTPCRPDSGVSPDRMRVPGQRMSGDTPCRPDRGVSPDRILSGDTQCRPDRGCRWDSAVSQDGWHCPGTRLCPRRGGVPRRELSWDARAVPGQRGGVSDEVLCCWLGLVDGAFSRLSPP